MDWHLGCPSVTRKHPVRYPLKVNSTGWSKSDFLLHSRELVSLVVSSECSCIFQQLFHIKPLRGASLWLALPPKHGFDRKVESTTSLLLALLPDRSDITSCCCYTSNMMFSHRRLELSKFKIDASTCPRIQITPPKQPVQFTHKFQVEQQWQQYQAQGCWRHLSRNTVWETPLVISAEKECSAQCIPFAKSAQRRMHSEQMWGSTKVFQFTLLWQDAGTPNGLSAQRLDSSLEGQQVFLLSNVLQLINFIT